MREVFVYVEGPSDQLGMRELFADVMEIAGEKGSVVNFYPLNGKEPLLTKGPIRAINILRNRPNSYVFLVPDLYPRNTPFPHSTYGELKNHLRRMFDEELQRRGADNSLADRFFVHCFKHDLEALLLASEEVLLKRLQRPRFSQSWTRPVEHQNHSNPPKRIVEALFRDAGMRYKDTADVPWVLKRSSHRDLVAKCPENFRLFVDDLFGIIGLEAA